MSTLKKTGHDVLVVGGGPAGMAAALFAARAGARVGIYEPNEKLGKKLYITGKGRCNLTNVADLEQTLQKIPRNPRFLHAALAAFDASALRGLMDELGVPTKVERGGRVFPVSEKASDVNRALERALRQQGVEICLNQGIKSVRAEQGRVIGAETASGAFLPCGALVLATGGASYPATGSTGAGYALAMALGHTVHSPRPALVPLISPATWTHALQGLSLRNVRLTARLGNKVLLDELGELLFTHFGLSGPLALTLSSYLTNEDCARLQLFIDLKPGMTEEQLHQRLLRMFTENPRKRWSGLLPELLPASLAAQFPALCDLGPEKPAHQVTKEERARIAGTLKALPVPISGLCSLEEAIITRGGVETKELTPRTLASRKVEGLFFAGELIDVDALTGGFNLQIAFSTGVCAGKAAADYALAQA